MARELTSAQKSRWQEILLYGADINELEDQETLEKIDDRLRGLDSLIRTLYIFGGVKGTGTTWTWFRRTVDREYPDLARKEDE